MNDDHDTWFREQVEVAICDTNDPKADWVPHAQVKADMAAQRGTLHRRVGGVGNDDLS